MNKYARIVHEFPRVRVLVVGDAMQDLYHFGKVERISPEAPVPVFVETHQKGRPGGAANVVANLVALGCQVDTVIPRGPHITAKHRYMVGHHHLFRIDRDAYLSPSDGDVTDAIRLAQHCDAVILSDYAKGWLTNSMCQSVIEASRGPVIVDPKGPDWSKYLGATVICPNSSERLEHAWDGVLLEKRGAQGLRLYGRDTFEDFPARARQVFDVTGAGDTVVAVVAAALSAGADFREACVLANAAAGVVVGKIGTSECSAEELLCALDSPTAASTDSTPDTDSSCSKPESIANGLSLRSIPTGLSRL